MMGSTLVPVKRSATLPSRALARGGGFFGGESVLRRELARRSRRASARPRFMMSATPNRRRSHAHGRSVPRHIENLLRFARPPGACAVNLTASPLNLIPRLNYYMVFVIIVVT